MSGKRMARAAFLVMVPLIGCDAGPRGAEADEAEVSLASIDRSGVTGTIRAEHEAEEAEVTLALEGLQPGARYSAAIHIGRCAAGGALAVPLGELTAGEAGEGTLERDVPASELSREDAAFVEVVDAAGEAVACADLPGHSGPEEALTDRIEPEDSAAAAGADPAAPDSPATRPDAPGEDAGV